MRIIAKQAGKQPVNDTEEKSPLLDCLKKNGVGEKKEFTGHKRVCGNCADVCPNRANVLIEVAADGTSAGASRRSDVQ